MVLKVASVNDVHLGHLRSRAVSLVMKHFSVSNVTSFPFIEVRLSFSLLLVESSPLVEIMIFNKYFVQSSWVTSRY